MFRSAYGSRLRLSQSFNPERSRVASEFKASCDVNIILKKYASQGVVTHLARGTPKYGDFSFVPEDYLAAQTMVLETRAAFERLPSAVRKRFSNRPEEFLEFVSDPENASELVSLGLAVERPVEAKNSSEGVSGTTPAEPSPKSSGGQKTPVSGDD